MKKFWLRLLILAGLVFPPGIAAYSHAEDVCYSQCAAYKFVWRGDAIYDLFASQCTSDEGTNIRSTIEFLKDVYDVAEGGENVDKVFTAWFVCKPLIEEHVAPELALCRNTCSNTPNYYAPNLSVGNTWGGIDYQGIYYDETNHNLLFKVVNNGLGYASDIDVSASWGHTRNRDLIVSGGGTLFTEKIPELLFFGARVGAPKTPGDYVTDFLIDQSNFAKYLQGFKSDADNHYIPPAWYKVVPFTAPAGEYTKVILNADPNKMITESNEGDNTFILEINNLPLPASFQIDALTSRRTNPAGLTDYLVSFNVKNNGEENGDAHVKWYEGKYASGKNPLFEQNMVVQAKNQVLFDHPLTVDVSNGGDSCNYSKTYTLVIFDGDGVKQTEREFSLPLYAGSISGTVKDLFGKKVTGATVTASTGQTSTVNNSGYYHITGIPTLGKVTVTAAHPDFSQPAVRDVEIKFDDTKDKCHIDGLTLNGIDLVLKDQEVNFTVTIKDYQGNPVTAKILAVNPDWRFNETINGTGPLPGMQPGRYTFTLSATGYKTISQDVNAVPNDQNLEFTLEKLSGRPDDTGLHLITPKLLWKKTLGTGERIIGNSSLSKNGKLLVVSAADNKAKTRSLFFLDPLTGKQIKETGVPYSVEQQRFVGLDTSYDGGTAGLFVSPGDGGILKIFNAGGEETGTTTFDKKLAVSMNVSPDGFYLCPHLLINKGLHHYSRYETEGIGDDDFKRNPASCGDYFFRNNNYLDTCKPGLCEKSIAGQEIRVIGKTKHQPEVIDSTANSQTVVVRTYDELYYFGQSVWNKELNSDNNFKSAAVSPGGMYTLVTEGSGSDTLLKLKIFGNTGGDKTPDFPYKDVRFVYANDRGLFFAQITLNKVEFYQVGEYQTEYNPEGSAKETGAETTGDLSRLSGDAFVPAGMVSFSTITPGLIYRAEKNLQLKYLNPEGTLNISKSTIFSKEYNHRPVLLKGQLTAEFGSPMKVYAIKFDRFDPALFQTKLNSFIAGNLPENEYFQVTNIHTKFTLTNLANNFKVAVETGQVKINTNKISKTVDQGKQVSIDAGNKVKETVFISPKIYGYAIGALLITAVGGWIIYRKKAAING